MSGFLEANEGEQAQPKRLIPLEQELAESDEDIVQEIELSGKFFSETEDTCTKLKKNPFQQRKLIKIGDNIKHSQLKCMKAKALEGLKAGNSSITSLINNYSFSNKKGEQLKLDLRQSLFEGTHEKQLDDFKAGRKKQIEKQKAAIHKKFPNLSQTVQRSALTQIIKTVDGFLQANEERIVSKASYLNEYVDFLLTVLLLGFHNTDVKIKDLEEQLHTLLTMDPNKAGLREVVKQQKGQQEFRASCCDKIVELEKRIGKMEKSNTNIDDSKPSSLGSEEEDIERKLGILFEIQNKLANDIEECCEKQEGKSKSSAKNFIEKLKCMFSRSSRSKTPEEEELCVAQTRATLENMGIGTGGRKKKTRRKKLRKNKISSKRKHLKFKKIKGGKRFKITKKKRNKRSRKIYYKKH